MAAELVLAPEAVNDIESAYAWYETRRAGLGEHFHSVVEAAFEGIRRKPGMHTAVHKGYSRAANLRAPSVALYCVETASRLPRSMFFDR